jgi:hypothetical protein
MAYAIRTALGRSVPVEDWGAIHGDTILKVLHDYRMSPFNPNNEPIDAEALCNATGLSPAEVQALCEKLAHEHYVEIPADRTYRITGEGVIFVRSLLTPSAMAGSPGP